MEVNSGLRHEKLELEILQRKTAESRSLSAWMKSCKENMSWYYLNGWPKVKKSRGTKGFEASYSRWSGEEKK